MAKGAVTFKGLKGRAFTCQISSPSGLSLTASGTLDDIDPIIAGSETLAANPALVSNLWAYAKQEKLARISRNDEKRVAHKKAAGKFRVVAETLARDVELLTQSFREGWCSECLTFAKHFRTAVAVYASDLYLCGCCGARTDLCPAPGCRNMASQGTRELRIPKYCAEHRHDIPGFEKAAARVATIGDYEELLDFDKTNLSAVAKVGSVATVVTAAAAITILSGGTGLPAAVGGAIGSLQGLSGAAAVSSGLATLGGGALSSGGLFAFGMAGGTMVVAAGGSALAGGLGASVMSAYVSDDKSFRIEKIHDGIGIPVLVANGFLTQGKSNEHHWSDALVARYPDSPIYVVHWGSTDLKRLTAVVAPRAAFGYVAKEGGKVFAKQGAKAAAAAADVWITVPALLAGAFKNPWHTAKTRADKTGVALASIIARTEADSYILVGHSLGARVMAVAAETLGTSPTAPKIREMHLLGAALGKKGEWGALSAAVQGTVHNYFSTNDAVLKYLYTTAQAGSTAVGLKGFGSGFTNIRDINVSRIVAGHSDYWGNVTLR